MYMKRKNGKNRGGSLIEIVLVVAALAFLVAVLTPQILEQVEQTKVSADTQLADSVMKAVMLALADPAVVEADEPGLPKPGAVLRLDNADDFSGAFGKAVTEQLGYDSTALMVYAQNGIVSELKSKGACGMTVTIDRFGDCVSAAVVDKDGSELIVIE